MVRLLNAKGVIVDTVEDRVVKLSFVNVESSSVKVYHQCKATVVQLSNQLFTQSATFCWRFTVNWSSLFFEFQFARSLLYLLQELCFELVLYLNYFGFQFLSSLLQESVSARIRRHSWTTRDRSSVVLALSSLSALVMTVENAKSYWFSWMYYHISPFISLRKM